VDRNACEKRNSIMKLWLRYRPLTTRRAIAPRLTAKCRVAKR
jgi:hypothetical protein